MCVLSKVAVIKGERGAEPVYTAFDLVPYKDALKDWDQVLIKVNFITTRNWETGATTDPVVVEAIINRVRDLGKEVIVVESDAQTTNASKAVVMSGMQKMLDRVGVEFVNMRHVDEKVELPVPDGRVLKKIKVAKIASESAIVSAAKLKTHMNTAVTLGMKNMFGMLTTKWKGKFHLQGMHKVIHDINRTLPPQLTVIDGFIAMEGRGPVHGKPVKMDTIIASTDPVAADATASRIMGFNPERIDHIKWAYQSGIGEINDIEVLGDGVDAVKRVFERL
ncbi:MAG: DUF362 domain-containing protein [Candidatus Bathyarchaeota archaeon]|nr:DUF362 domain-containing protein [Candidatus Bathyarchaeota archaeon]